MLRFALTEIAHRRTYIQLLWVHTSILTKGQKGDTSRSAKLPNWQSSLESKTCYIWPRILFAFLTIFKVNMVVRLRVYLSMALHCKYLHWEYNFVWCNLNQLVIESLTDNAIIPVELFADWLQSKLYFQALENYIHNNYLFFCNP